jgi:hypothetical protein
VTLPSPTQHSPSAVSGRDVSYDGYASGINVDSESPLEKDSDAMKGHTDLMHRLGEAQRPAVPRHGQGPALLVRAAWSPAASTFRFCGFKAPDDIFDSTIVRTTAHCPGSSPAGLVRTHRAAPC